MLPVHDLQGEVAAGPHGEYHSYPSPGASVHQLLVPGAREGEVMDHFIHYTQAYVTQSQMAQIMVKALWDNFSAYYGLPGKSFWTRAGILRASS